MNHEEMLHEGNIPILWISEDRATHIYRGLGWFYRRATPNEWENVANWATPESYALDREAFKEHRKRYAEKYG